MVKKADNIVADMINDDKLEKHKLVVKPKKETRSDRLPPGYATPTLKKRFLEKCKREDISANEVYNQLIESWLNE